MQVENASVVSEAISFEICIRGDGNETEINAKWSLSLNYVFNYVETEGWTEQKTLPSKNHSPFFEIKFFPSQMPYVFIQLPTWLAGFYCR